MKRIAFVVQRYGIEVNGGAELHCRQLVEHMSSLYDVEVITTKAVDYTTWEDVYENDLDYVNGIPVHRFPVDAPRNMQTFNALSESVLSLKSSVEQEEEWMKKQGPYSTELLQFLREHKADYDCFVFFTYLYATTYYGLQVVGDKAVIIPTAHDELPIYLKIFKKMFQLPQGYFYNTREEKDFVEHRFHIEKKLNNQGLGGVGVEVPDTISAERFRKKYHIDQYMLYIGRIDEHKGCKELFRYFFEYKKRNQNDLKLVLMGKAVIDIPVSNDIINLGFVSDEDKFDGLLGSKFLILPSEFESLSMVVLEAMKLKVPVIVNGKCIVLKGHCTNSNGGLYYTDYFEFEGCVQYILSHPEESRMMGILGEKYVNENYRWDAITRRLSDMIEKIGE